MKKLFLSIILVGLILTGCSNTSNNNAENIVKELYDAAFNRDISKVDSLLKHFIEYDRYAEEIQEDLYDTVADLGGISHLNIDSPKKKELNQEIIEGLNDSFNDNWKVVSVEMDEDYIMVWILQEIDGDLYIIDGEDFNTDEIYKSEESNHDNEVDEKVEEEVSEVVDEEHSQDREEALEEERLMQIEMESGLPSHAMNENMSGEWIGTYTASQGSTSMKINFMEEDFVVFEFGPTDENPDVPLGKIQMGEYYDAASNTMRLFGKEWIEQPSGYYFVDFFGSRSNQFYNGVVAQEEKIVGTFSVETTDDTDFPHQAIPESLSGMEMAGTYETDDAMINLNISFQNENTAHFEFEPTFNNTEPSSGKLVQEVKYNPERGILYLQGLQWVEPAGAHYDLVDFIGSINGDYYSGVVYTSQSQQIEGYFKVKIQ